MFVQLLHGAKSGFHMGALGSLPQEKFENYDVIIASTATIGSIIID